MTGSSTSNESTGWAWFAGDNEEFYRVGPCASRAEAVAEAGASNLGLRYDPANPGATIYMIEALRDPVDLSDWIDFDTLVEILHERLADDLGGEDGESPADGAWTEAQQDDLEAAIKATVAEWQARHAIVVVPTQFTATRNAERLDLENEAASTAAVNPSLTPGSTHAAP